MSAAPGLWFRGDLRAGGRRLCPPVDLQVPAAGWTCLLGPSGVGKSTLLHLFAGLAPEATSTGAWGARDGATLTGRVALMAQSDMLMPWLTVLENTVIGARLRGQDPDLARASHRLEEVGLAALCHRKPSQLSGGQRQRAALARTLYEDRPVVLLDEPFSALDVATRAAMQDLAAERLAGRTVLHVTHDPAEAARLGQHVLVLTARGLCRVDAAAGAPPRAPDAPATLKATGVLTRRLLEAAA